MKIKQFFKSNLVYIFWFTVYVFFTTFLFGFHVTTFIVVLLLYLLCSLFVALSDTVVRLSMQARKLITEEDENLSSIFEEVYEEARNKFPYLNTKLYVVKNEGFKIQAISKKTIVISKLAIETFSDEELRGLLAHEFGRIIYNDVKVNQFVSYGNLLFSYAIYLANYIYDKQNKSKEKNTNTKVVYKKKNGGISLFQVLKVVLLLIAFLIFLLLCFVSLIGSIPVLVNMKSRIFKSDKFTCELGYSEELKQALYTLDKLEIVNNQVMKVDYAYRIAKIEEFETNN